MSVHHPQQAALAAARTGCRSRPAAQLTAIIALWLLSVGAGAAVLLNYSARPGDAGSTQPEWPAGSNLARASGEPTLIMFVHPRCPCTAASIEELGRLLARCGKRTTTYVVLWLPSPPDLSWLETAQAKRAMSLPGVRVIKDVGGRETARFGIQTSGHVLLYSADGRVRFSGGITAARGHEGDSLGRSAVEGFLLTGSLKDSVTPVYGCSFDASGSS